MGIRLQVPQVLYVDPDEESRQAFDYALLDHAEVLTAQTPEDALQVLKSCQGIAVVVTELQLGQMTGVEFLRRAREVLPGTMNILVTAGLNDATLLMDAINSGLVWSAWNKSDEEYLRELSQIIAQAASEQARRQCETALAVAAREVARTLVQRREKDADGSVARREHLARMMAPYLDMSALELALLPVAALVHGLESVVPGSDVCKLLGDLPAAVPALRPLSHALEDARECFDGTGPNKKAGTQIAALARVLAVVDHFDRSMAATQGVHEFPDSIRKVFEALQLQAGIWFDPSAVTALEQMVRQHRSAVEGLYWQEAK